MASPIEGSQTDLKILIFGKAGSGKSTLGNLILGKEVFGTQQGMERKTTDHQAASEYFPRLRCHIRVVDTPDIECFSNNQKAVEESINMWKGATDQDPDAILYTIRCDDKYGDSTHEKYKRIKKLWGPRFCENLIVAFTFGDNAVRDIQQDIALAGQHLKDVLAHAGQRYLLFNRNFPRTEQVDKLVKMMLQMRPPSATGSYPQTTLGAAPPLPPSKMDTSHTNDERKLSVVIIGRSKTGKTTLGSAIVGKQLPYRMSEATSTTVKIGSTNVTVVDTPDLVDRSTLDPKDQVSKWKELSGSEPDVILLAVRFDKKYIERDLQLYKMVKKTWGQDDFKRRFAVVFTFADRKQEDILGKLGPEFAEVWKDVNQRYVFFDDKTAESRKHIVHFMIRIFESLSSFGAMNAIGTTNTHGHSGHFAKDVLLPSSGSTTHIAYYEPSSSRNASTVLSPRKDLSILVIGKAGTGKSSLANAILGKGEFEIAVGMRIQTQTAAKGSASLSDLNLTVVDTPDITNLSGEISKQDEIKKWIDLTRPGPDVIVLAIRCDSKYTPEDFAMYQELQRMGLKSVLEQKLLVVFTFGDQRQPDFEGDIRRAGSNLRAVMKDAGKRRLIYNDKVTSEKDAFFRELLHMVSSTPDYQIQTPSRHL